MKAIFLKFTDEKGNIIKTFTACSLKTGMMDNLLDLAERGQKMEQNPSISEVRQYYRDVKALIVSVFQNQFTYDELNANVEEDELKSTLQSLFANISGEMQKN